MVTQPNQAQPPWVRTTRQAAVAAVSVAAVGIHVQSVGGADSPVVPPGALFLLAAAALFACRSRWGPLIGLFVPVFLSIGALVTPNRGDQLADTSEATVLTGTVIQLVGLLCGTALTVNSVRKGRQA